MEETVGTELMYCPLKFLLAVAEIVTSAEEAESINRLNSRPFPV